jgi:hypothetical protein
MTYEDKLENGIGPAIRAAIRAERAAILAACEAAAVEICDAAHPFSLDDLRAVIEARNDSLPDDTGPASVVPFRKGR